mmetsp:Transcript_24607/g.79125  ORF Transcript_24607/g.79125 Transcript_24607/m.79125 type:complete len:217 (+) Transcript_24607:2174-2824(+)
MLACDAACAAGHAWQGDAPRRSGVRVPVPNLTLESAMYSTVFDRLRLHSPALFTRCSENAAQYRLPAPRLAYSARRRCARLRCRRSRHRGCRRRGAVLRLSVSGRGVGGGGARLADRRRAPADGLRGAAGAWVCDSAHSARMDPLPRARRAGGGVCGGGGGAASNGDGGGGGDGRRGAAGRPAENCGGRGKESCGKEGSSADCASVALKQITIEVV